MQLKDIGFLMLRFLGSWLGILIVAFVGLMVVDSSEFLRTFLIALCGVLGAYAAYFLHYGERRSNPYQKLQRIWIIPRSAFVLLVSALALLLATALLFQGISLKSGEDSASASHIAAANAFFFFGAVYGIAGMLSISDAKLQLRKASFDRKEKWREDATHPDRRPSVMDRGMTAAHRLTLLPESRIGSQSIESEHRN
jgi:hypothetical protein